MSTPQASSPPSPAPERPRFLAATVQMTASSDREGSMAQAVRLIERAAAAGARLIATPEATNYLGPHDRKVREAESVDGPTCSEFAQLAERLGVFLLLGSFNERGDDQRCANTSVLFGPDGSRLASYRKIHLFDVDVSDDLRFFESDTTVAGEEPVCVATPLGNLGLTICYDLRFPELYAKLRAAGAEVLLVPSAFTATTGAAHWVPLLRARAIETQCWVIAPGQFGEHDDGGLRRSYGHSLIVDPWGQVSSCVPDGEGIGLAEIDLDRVDDIRRKMPVAQHRRLGTR